MAINKQLKARVKAATPKQRVAPQVPGLVELRKKALSPSTQLAEQAKSVTVTDAADYETADGYLVQLNQRIKANSDGIAPILSPLKEAKKACDDLIKALNGPLKDAESYVREQMRQWRLKEIAETAPEAEAINDDADRVQEQALELERRAQQAKTPGQAQTLLNKALETQQRADEIRSTAPTGVEVEGSGYRGRKVWEVVDLKAVARGVLKGEIPSDVLEVSSKIVNGYFRDSQETVAEWPGFEVKQDVSIVRRGER